MAGPDVVTIRDTVTVAQHEVDVVQVGYTFLTSEGSHSHTPDSIGALAAANNLSDVANAVTARANLGAETAGAAAAAVSGHAAASDPHPVYLTQTEGDARYAPLGSGGMDQVYPISDYGWLAASCAFESVIGTSGLSSGTIFATRTWVPAGVPITNLTVAIQTGGTYTSGSGNRLAVYDETGATQLGITADDPTLWATAGRVGRPLAGGVVAAQSTGRMVYILILAIGYTGIFLPFSVAGSNAAWFSSGVGNGSRRRCMFSGGETALPASFNPNTLGSATSFLPVVGVS